MGTVAVFAGKYCRDKRYLEWKMFLDVAENDSMDEISDRVNDYLSKPLLYSSAYFNEYKLQYVRLMRAVSEEGSWEPWMSPSLRGLVSKHHTPTNGLASSDTFVVNTSENTATRRPLPTGWRCGYSSSRM